MKKFLAAALVAALALSLCACDTTIAGAGSVGVENATKIVFTGDSARISGGGASANGAVITISAAGAYALSGKLDDGQIVVDTGDDPGLVTLFLDNADISNSADSAILVSQAREVTLYTVKDSDNYISSGSGDLLAAADENASGAAIFSEDDLTLNGEGDLTISGYINNAVTCKDDLEVSGGALTLNAANNGLRGSESVTISGGDISIAAVNDAVKSTSSKKEGKGYVEISGGKLTADVKGDGVSAETVLKISGGELVILTQQQGDKSCKGLKAIQGLTVSGGSITVTAADHALHCDAGIEISGGTVAAESLGGKAMAAHGEIAVSGGALTLIAADDGMDTPGNITVSGGLIDITAGKNGIKAGDSVTGAGFVTVKDGTITIMAASDGVDAQSSLVMEGGTLLSLGSSKRMKGFSESSTQPYLEAELTANKGDALSILSGGRTLAEYMLPLYGYNTVLFSSPELATGSSYTLNFGSATMNATAR